MEKTSDVGADPQEPRIRARLLWPFLRARPAPRSSPSPSPEDILRAEGLGLDECVRQDALVSSGAAMRALARYVRESGDATVGLRAGSQLEPGDLDVVEHAARSSADLHAALSCATRYAALLSEPSAARIVEERDVVELRLTSGEHALDPAAAEDFVVACAVGLVVRCAGAAGKPREVHLMHEAPRNADAYESALGATVRFAMPRSALVFERAQMSLPLPLANRELCRALEAYARELLDRRPVGLRGHVAELASQELSRGRITMEALARQVGASPATLRRRLDREGTSFRSIVRDLRRALAERLLLERRLSISEVAFEVGFSNVRAFHKAFRRWNGVSPSAFRAHPLGGAGASA
jgi:AraC-like DNA-binding protein